MNDTTARDNYLPSRRGTGCKSCGVWTPERLTVEEFAKLPHQFGCPLDPDYEPVPYRTKIGTGF